MGWVWSVVLSRKHIEKEMLVYGWLSPFSPFIQSVLPAHWIVQATFRSGLTLSGNPVETA